MRTYLIGYDLNRPRGADDYPDLFKAIKALANGHGYWHHLDSTWIIKTNSTAAQIRDALKPHVDSGDELLVVRLTGEGAWAGFNQAGSDWLMTYLTYE
jgi:hypothetical protein